MNLQEHIKRILREETNIPKHIRRRMLSYNPLDIMKKKSLGYFKTKDSLDSIVERSAVFAAIEILPWHDHNGVDYPQEQHDEWTKILTKYFINRYGKETEEYIKKTIPENSFDNDGHKYTIWKHSEINGGAGFAETYNTWGDLIIAYGWWFPLDWAEIKSELDKMDNGKKIILRPNDPHNTMGYYFSIIKK
jgi:hypothetical protein